MLKLSVKYWQPRVENGRPVAQALLTGPGFDHLDISSVERKLQPVEDPQADDVWAYNPWKEYFPGKSKWHLFTGTGIEIVVPEDQLDLDITKASNGNQPDNERRSDCDSPEHRQDGKDGQGHQTESG